MIEEFDLFGYATPKFKIDKPVRLIELFGGIGSQAKSLKNLGITLKLIDLQSHHTTQYSVQTLSHRI